MKKAITPLFGFCAALLLIVSSACLLPVRAAAVTDATGNWKYTVNSGGTTVTLTGCVTAPTGVVTVPETLDGKKVTAIGSSSFSGYSGMTGISLPHGITSIGDNAFYSCSGLSALTIPDTVQTIGSRAFYYCIGLTDITIPSSVTALGSAAFRGCSGLMSAALNGQIASIAEQTFSECSKLASVSIPGTVRVIGDSAFYKCTGLTDLDIPAGVTEIGSSAFSRCTGLKTVLISKTVTQIADYAFRYDSALQSFEVAADNSVYSSADGVLLSKNGEKLIQYPAGKNETVYSVPSGVKTIGNWAFAFCSKLTDITLTDNVSSIGDTAFYSCTALKEMTIPASVASIGSTAFGSCTSLSSVVLLGKIARIGYSVFSDCSSLTDVSIPDGVTSIGELAFLNCAGLLRITIPASVTSIENWAFSGCGSLVIYGISGSAAQTYAAANNIVFRTALSVSFDPNGGISSAAGKTVIAGETIGILPAAAREGFSFAGWFTSAGGGSQMTAGSVVSQTGDFKLYAQWTANAGVGVVTVTFNANGGTADLTERQQAVDKAMGSMPLAARTGYTFVGWYTEPGAGEAVTKDTIVTAANILYAHWTPRVFTVTFDANGGSVTPKSKEVTYGGRYGDLPVPLRAGFDFAGWNTLKTGGAVINAQSTVGITEAQTLYAQWTAGTYTVRFDANGGNVAPANKTVTYGSAYGILPAPTREYYTFAGWFTEADGGTVITPETTVGITSAATLYAHWTGNPYTVSFNATIGDTPTSGKTVYYGGTYGDLPVAVRRGYSFLGWFTDANGGVRVTSSDPVTITAAQTLYARWTINAYTILFNANGGSVSTASMSVIYGSIYGTLPVPVRAGYDFSGWFTAADGGTQVTAAAAVTVTAAQTLYAHWTYSSDVRGFVTRLYAICLDRSPDAGGLADWTGQLNAKTNTGAGVAYGFLFSSEFRAKNLCNSDFVKYLYRAFFDREADEEGFRNWTGLLETGTTREAVYNGFVGSREFTNLCNSYGIARGDGIEVPQYGTVPTGSCSVCGETDGVTAFVKRLYNVSLNRSEDAPGLKDWTGQLWAHTNSGAGVAFGFIFSQEFRSRGLSNEDFVTCMYRTFFDRGPDSAGYADWLGRLNGGASRESVFHGFSGSQEFTDLCNKFGIVRE